MKVDHNVELLAPAGSYEAFEAALGAGADAVYVGGPDRDRDLADAVLREIIGKHAVAIVHRVCDDLYSFPHAYSLGYPHCDKPRESERHRDYQKYYGCRFHSLAHSLLRNLNSTPSCRQTYMNSRPTSRISHGRRRIAKLYSSIPANMTALPTMTPSPIS